MAYVNIQFLIFVYIYVSCCVVVFDVLFLAHSKYTTLRFNGRTKWIDSRIQDMLEEGKRSNRLQDGFERKLHSIQYLRVFHEYVKDKKEDNDFVAWVNKHVDMFFDLEVYYETKKDEYIAFYAYLLGSLPFDLNRVDKNTLSTLCKRLIVNMANRSVYVRENSIRVIVRFGQVVDVVTMVSRLNQFSIHQNKKLLTDHLLKFHGNHRELLGFLWRDFSKYSEEIQVAFIDYTKLLPKQAVDSELYFEEYVNLLKDAQTRKEVRIAVLRYFRKYSYEPVFDILIELLEYDLTIDWEYAAIAASTLSNYPRDKTIRALIQATTSRNWFVRLNASESLIYMEDNIDQVLQSTDDKYTAEMLLYRLKLKELREKKRGAHHGTV